MCFLTLDLRVDGPPVEFPEWPVQFAVFFFDKAVQFAVTIRFLW